MQAKLITAAAILVLAPLALGPGAAEAAPNLSGTYVRDNAQSSPAPAPPLYWIVRAPPAQPGNGRGPAVSIELQQAPGALKVTLPGPLERTYKLDGRPHPMPAETGILPPTATASEGPDSIVVVTTQPYSGMPGSVTLKTTDTWTLSPDRKVLTLTTVLESPARTETFKAVYNRQ